MLEINACNEALDLIDNSVLSGLFSLIRFIDKFIKIDFLLLCGCSTRGRLGRN